MAETNAVGTQADTPILVMLLRAASLPRHLRLEDHNLALHG